MFWLKIPSLVATKTVEKMSPRLVKNIFFFCCHRVSWKMSRDLVKNTQFLTGKFPSFVATKTMQNVGEVASRLAARLA